MNGLCSALKTLIYRCTSTVAHFCCFAFSSSMKKVFAFDVNEFKVGALIKPQ